MNELKQVLLATDGSERARLAVDLVAAMRWAPGTQIEVLDVYEPIMPGAEVPPDLYVALDKYTREQIDIDLAAAKKTLTPLRADIQPAMRQGRAATEIVREAERMGADLIVVGSRGRGPLATMMLGSVAAEVVDRAPCPVLVARTSHLERFAVTDDGSAAAANAVKAATEWPVFKGLSARALSVAPVNAITGVGPIRHEDAKQRYAEGVDAMRAIYGSIADETAMLLSRAGIPADAQTRFGDPAQEIIDGAIEYGADLIVMGSRGQTGLERFVIGSVARNVLTHAPMSVLIVHPAGER